MNEMTNTQTQRDSKYFLRDRERWENLGFDWKGWNSTVAKILKKQAAPAAKEQQ